MRILFVASNIQCPGTNGGSTHVTEVVQHLRERDEVLLLARSGSTLEDTLAVGSPLPVRGLRQANALRLAAITYRRIKQFAPDVIYERASSYGLGAALGRALQVPTLCMMLDNHGCRLSLATARRIIATNAGVVPERYRGKLTLVSWGANTRRFRPDVDGAPVRSRYGIQPDQLLVGYTGGFYPWHGLEELVEAAAILSELPVSYLLVGDGERAPKLRAMVKERGLADRFIFSGRVSSEEVPEHVAACDVCVAPYNPARHPYYRRSGEFVYDPLKIFEYLAAGKAAVTLQCETVGRLFVHDRELVTFQAGNAGDLASKMRALLEDPERRRCLGRAGRRLVEQSHSWRAHADTLRAIFEEMLEAGRRC